MPFWKKEPSTPQTLASLVRGLQHAVNSAMEMLEARNVEILGRFFTDEGLPITKRLQIDEETSVDIPIISIVNPLALSVKEVEMEFSVQVNGSEVKKRQPQKGFIVGKNMEELKTEIERTSLEVSFSGIRDANTMNVKIKFESTPIPEGMARIVDEFDKKIIPFDKVQ